VLPRTTPAVSARLCPCCRVITLLGDSCLDEIQYAENVVNLMTVPQFLEIWTFWTHHECMCSFLITCQYKVNTEMSYIHFIIYIYFSQHTYIIKAYVKATCFDLKSHRQVKLRTMKFFTMWLCAFGIPDGSQCVL